MGGGSWDTASYTHAATTRATKGVPDFEYTKTAKTTHANLDPKRISSKPFGKLEARDSVDHPNSVPILMCFDVTGSNRDRAVVAQQRLPQLMTLLNRYLPDPQVAVAANDDYKVEGVEAVQISDFESDNRVDEHIRTVRLIGNGGGNDGESYDLLLYAAARKVVTDAIEKRGKKGYLFMYADEPFFKMVSKAEVKAVYGDAVERDIPIAEIIEEARRLWNIFIVFPTRGFVHARDQYVQLFGEEAVIDSQDPNLLCELVAGIVGLYEKKTTGASLVTDLVHVGVKQADAHIVSSALVKTATYAGSTTIAPHSGAGKAARL